MLNRIRNFFRSTRLQKDQFRPESPFLERFRRDYINADHDLRYQHLQPHVRAKLVTYVEELVTDYSSDRDFIPLAFTAIKNIYLVRWLSKTGYGRVLSGKMKQLEYVDDYGDLELTASMDELSDFVFRKHDDISDVVEGTIENYYRELAKKRNEEWCLLTKKPFNFELDDIELMNSINSNDSFDNTESDILAALEFFKQPANDNNESTSFSFNTADPYEYEHLIAEFITSKGWPAKATSGSGDQGADVIAEKDGEVIVIQCKLYSQPVGNKAVQEVFAAKGYYQADYAVVVTNNSYTKSARQLSNSLGVHLAHHDQLDEVIDSFELLDTVES